MPSYNTASYIGRSIQSVLDQTYPNWELIIVDDCSTDNTLEVIRSFQDDRIRLFQNPENSGAAVSRNRALREAKGRYIAFLDSDDIWYPQKLERQLQFMQSNGYGFTYTDYCLQLNGVMQPYIYTAPDVINKRKMYQYCYFSTITVMYDAKKVGLIQIESIRKNNDYAMWLQAVEKTDFHRLPECLSCYIKHEGSVSSGSKLRLIKWHYLLYRKAMKRGVLVSSVLTVQNLFFGVLKKLFYRKKRS